LDQPDLFGVRKMHVGQFLEHLYVIGGVLAIGQHCAGLPDLDPRAPNEIVGYDRSGIWR